MLSSSVRESDSNVTGSPLEDDKSIHEIMSKSLIQIYSQSYPWEQIEESYTPIPINTARNILNDLIAQKFPKAKGWIFFLCSDDRLPIEKSIFLLATHLMEGICSRGLANYHGVVSHEDKMMRNLMNRHKSIATGIKNSTPEVQIENIFEMTPNITVKFIDATADEKSSLSSIDKFTEVILYLKVEIERGSEVCKELWEQISLLHLIHSDIVRYKSESGDGTIAEPTYTYGSMSFERLQQRISNILSDAVTINENEMENIDTVLEAVIKRVTNRPLIEVTDQLWDLLKFASSYTDLKRIISFVFQISSRSSIVNIPMSNTRMAELIRELSNQRLAIPHLTSTEPLELLLEIGLEKIMKDYEYVFSESKICLLNEIKIGEGKSTTSKVDNRFSVRKSLAASADIHQNASNRKTLLHGVSGSPDSLNDFDGLRNSRFNEKESLSTISKLAQIHLAMEHLVLIQSHLNLNHDYASITRKMLENPTVNFEDLLKQKINKFEIPVVDKNVGQLVNKLIPNAQRISIRSENKFKAVESIFYFNIEQIVPFLVQKENEDDQPIDKKGNSFHFLSYSNIESKF